MVVIWISIFKGQCIGPRPLLATNKLNSSRLKIQNPNGTNTTNISKQCQISKFKCQKVSIILPVSAEFLG